MANEFARNIVDSELTKTGALPTADGTSYTGEFDLGSAAYKTERIEFAITIPDLTTTNLPDADTLTVNVVSGSATAPTTVLHRIKVYTGAGGAGATGSTTRWRPPSDIAQYVRFQMVAAGGTGDMSAKTATVKLLT